MKSILQSFWTKIFVTVIKVLLSLFSFKLLVLSLPVSMETITKSGAKHTPPSVRQRYWLSHLMLLQCGFMSDKQD